MNQKNLSWSWMLQLLITSALLVFATSCKDDDDKYEGPQVAVESSETDNTFIVGTEGGERQLSLKTNRAWYTEKDGDWFTLTPEKGEEGNVTIKVIVKENTGDARMGGFKITASGKSFYYTILQKSSDGKDVKFSTLAEVQEMAQDAGKDGKVIDQDIFIKCIIVTSYKGRNLGPFQNFNYAMDAYNNGIVITQGKEEQPYEYGDQITANIKGCKVSNYAATIQVELPREKAAVVSGQKVEPIPATIKDVAEGKYKMVLVRIPKAQFVKYQDQKMYDGTFFMKSHELQDPEGNTCSLEVLKGAAFKDKDVPQGSGEIVAIAAIYQKDENSPMKYALKPSLFEDIKFTGDRFEVNGQNPTPDPNPNPTPDPEPAKDVKPLTSLYELGRGLEDGKFVTINESYNVEVTVTANNDTKQLPGDFIFYVQDKEGNAIAMTRAPKETWTYSIGDKLLINVNGGSIKNYKGTLQFSPKSDNIKKQGVAPVKPFVTTVEKLDDTMMNKLVKIEGVQIDPTPQAGTKLDSGEKYTTWNLISKSGAKCSISIKGGCTFGNNEVPTGSGSVTGILGKFDGAFQLKPIKADDIRLTEPRF